MSIFGGKSSTLFMSRERNSKISI